MAAVGQLVAPIRKVLGDIAPESRQMNAGETFTSTSLDAVHNYALGQEFQWKGQLAEASKYYSEAIRTDPDLGRVVAGRPARRPPAGHGPARDFRLDARRDLDSGPDRGRGSGPTDEDREWLSLAVRGESRPQHRDERCSGWR